MLAKSTKVTGFDEFKSTFATVTHSIGDWVAAISSSHHAVDHRALEGPCAVHAFRGEQFGVEVLIGPSACY